MIKTGPASKEYRDNWSRIFGNSDGAAPDASAVAGPVNHRITGHHAGCPSFDLLPKPCTCPVEEQ